MDFGRHVLELARDGVVEHRHPERQVGPHVGAQQGQAQGVGVVAGDHGDRAPVALAQHRRGFAVAQVERRGGRRAALLEAPQQRRAEPATLAEHEDGAGLGGVLIRRAGLRGRRGLRHGPADLPVSAPRSPRRHRGRRADGGRRRPGRRPGRAPRRATRGGASRLRSAPGSETDSVVPPRRRGERAERRRVDPPEPELGRVGDRQLAGQRAGAGRAERVFVFARGQFGQLRGPAVGGRLFEAQRRRLARRRGQRAFQRFEFDRPAFGVDRGDFEFALVAGDEARGQRRRRHAALDPARRVLEELRLVQPFAGPSRRQPRRPGGDPAGAVLPLGERRVGRVVFVLGEERRLGARLQHRDDVAAERRQASGRRGCR